MTVKEMWKNHTVQSMQNTVTHLYKVNGPYKVVCAKVYDIHEDRPKDW